jgi:hypothetical protein
MRKAILPLIVALGLAACSAVPVPKTAAQTVYALDGAYITAARAEAAYIVSPHADPGAVAAIRQADQVAYDALVGAQKAVQSGQSGGKAAGRAGAQFKESGGKAAEAAALSAAQDGISALVSLLHNKGII